MNLNETHTFCNAETICQFINELPYGFECQLCSFESDNFNIIMSHMKEKHSNEIVLSLKELHSDETKNIAAISPYKYNVKNKNQAISKDKDKKWLRPKPKKRRNRDDVSLLRTVLKQVHLQSVAMSQEFQMEDEENNKRKLRDESLLKIVLERTHHRSVVKVNLIQKVFQKCAKSLP